MGVRYAASGLTVGAMNLTRFCALAAVLTVAPGARAARAQTAPTLTLVPELRIDGNDHEWSRIDAVHVAKNGNIYVRSPGDFTMWMFSPKGELVKKFARKGDGPGEVRAATASGIVGDSLYISEIGLLRLSLYGLDGTPGRVIRPTNTGEWIKTYPDAGNYTTKTFIPTRLLPNNLAIGSGLILNTRIGENMINRFSTFRLNWEGVASGVVAEKSFGAFRMQVNVPGMNGYPGRQPFVDDPLFLYSPSGNVAVADVVESPSPAILISYFNINGDTIRRARIPYTPVPVTSRMVDSVIPEIAKTIKREGHEDVIRKAMVVPKYFWPIGRGSMADDGTTWLQLRGNTPNAQWLVVSPQGKLTGVATLPRSADILLIQDGVWAVVKDDDDVPSVVHFRIK